MEAQCFCFRIKNASILVESEKQSIHLKNHYIYVISAKEFMYYTLSYSSRNTEKVGHIDTLPWHRDGRKKQEMEGARRGTNEI